MQFCFADGNEEEFVLIAEKLGIKELCFVYSDVKKIAQVKSRIKVFKALLCNGKNMDKKKLGVDFILMEHSDKDRHVIENRLADILFNIETNMEKDFMHARNSGFNQVLAELCRENKVTVAFNFNMLLNTSGRERINLLGRMNQNMMLCRKYKVKSIVSNFVHKPMELRNDHSLEAFEKLL